MFFALLTRTHRRNLSVFALFILGEFAASCLCCCDAAAAAVAVAVVVAGLVAFLSATRF